MNITPTPKLSTHTYRKHQVNQIVRRIQRKRDAFRNGGWNGEEERVGILPKEGWKRRNVEFLQKMVLPTMFRPRIGNQAMPVFDRLDSDKIGLTWIGHASFLMQIGGLNVLIDPNWALWHGIVKRVRRPGLAIQHLPKIDAVLITHAHFDHLHLPTLGQIASGQPIIVPHGVGKLVRNLPFGAVHELDWWDSVTVEGVEITLTPAKHWGARYIHDVHRGFGGYLVKSADRSVFHCGDSAAFDGFDEIGERSDIEIALLPIGAYEAPSGRAVHMNPEEAVEAFQQLKAKMLVPMHYGTFPLGGEPLHEPIERLAQRAIDEGLADSVRILEEGSPWIF